MKIEFIKRGAETRLILIFAGWSTSPRFYNDITFEGWDTAVVYDYSDLSVPIIPPQYKTVFLFAYSLGVWAADFSNIDSAVSIAIAGTPKPASDSFGIPSLIFKGTAENLDQRNLVKFHRRMCGSRQRYESLLEYLPENPDIESLANELLSIYRIAWKPDDSEILCSRKWNRAYIPSDDAIIPTANQLQWWNTQSDTETILIDSPHAVGLRDIILSIIPDTKAVGGGFQKSLPFYKENAICQKESAMIIAEYLKEYASSHSVDSILEIGSGPGLLTGFWKEIIHPQRATFVDLYPSDIFHAAESETYIVADAEEWIDSNTEKYDVILSASAIQWFADPIRFLKGLKRNLAPEGIAIISTFVKGNLHELDRFRPSPIIYRSYAEYAEVADTIKEWKCELQFSGAKSALMHLRHTGVSGKSKSGAPLSEILKGLEDGILTYRPAVIVVRNSPGND